MCINIRNYLISRKGRILFFVWLGEADINTDGCTFIYIHTYVTNNSTVSEKACRKRGFNKKLIAKCNLNLKRRKYNNYSTTIVE